MSNFIGSIHRTSVDSAASEATLNQQGSNRDRKYVTDQLTVWYANIDDVASLADEDPLIMSLLPDEKIKVKRFLFPDDQKRALLSILLQRALIRSHAGVGDNDYELRRSREGKPFVVSRSGSLTFRTWNFNVSHHGKYVAIVAHPTLLVGVDIVDISTRSNMSKSGTAMQFVEIFEPQLTTAELAAIASQATEDDRFSYFYIIWALKEAYIKAIGQGLGYDLQQVEFAGHFEPGFGLSDNNSSAEGELKGSATVHVAGQLRQDWRMDFVSLDRTHVMTISRGPLREALSSYQTLAGWDKFLTPNAHDREGSGRNNNCRDRMNAKGMKYEWEPLPAAERKLVSDLYPPHA